VSGTDPRPRGGDARDAHAAAGTQDTGRAAPDLAAVRGVIETARAAGRVRLTEPEGMAILRAIGIAVPRWRTVRGADEVDEALLAGFPGDLVVVKVVSAAIAHKTEVGGVAVVARTHAAVAAAIDAMRGRLGGAPEGFLVVEHVAHPADAGGELLLSLRWTDDFGPVVSVGAGGTATEALAADLRPERALAVISPAVMPPGAVRTAVAGTTAGRLATTPQRSQPPRIAPARVEEAVERLLALARLVPDDLLEVEVNPAAVTAGGLVALDVLATLGDGPRLPRPPRPAAALRRLYEPATIAIVGVSSGTNPGRVILGNILREGFPPDRVVVIKPGVDRIDGVRCVPGLEALPAKADLLVVALSADRTPGFVAEVVERDLAASMIVIPAGFDEKSGGDALGTRMRDALAASRTRPDGGPVVNGGNCLGIRSRPGRYDTLFIPRWKLPPGDRPAPIALLTGSGAFAITRLSRLGHLDPRYVVTIGNQLDLTVADHLEHLAGDDAVRVFGVYLEGFARLDGIRFAQVAARIVRDGRQVILYRAGRTAAGVSASASHTASIAGDAVVAREIARAAGVTVADTPGEFDDLLRAFALLDGRPARGRRLGAVSNAGSECVTIADHAGSLEVAAFSPETEARLAAILGPAGVASVVDVHDPLDLTPIADAAVTEEVVRAVLDADEVDVGIVGHVPLTDTVETLPPGPGHPEDLDRPGAIAERLARVWRGSTKPWVAVVDAGPLYAPFVARLEAAGIPVLGTADAATRVLAAWCDATLPAEWRR
jgi:acyl-CoA synthetase (NDP forming)